ncbi:MAG: leucine--tRNA ligase [Candidatus Vogelbacteria bacterium CG10_big_fil_rev_8_21_14_0_10_45_14]|uniref:Leucine--tRNA ligase n=1 Tax=Candidatus Vogelbacteria bacterium CG10_big_fil_rev_8_21_14_0_10_45_14 TaxID=1975042 RepID=A0A2H0RKY1_9BACT|nr:MAG: leucine--tRNA ligase [Candidatus Vogelbacteria bacterium CG10_big_fil_rev_8_21_14_0_10_45_14]
MTNYDHKTIERKWQEKWDRDKTYRTRDMTSSDKKCYVLDMFPYPSGEAMHVGHPKGYIATDVYSRMKRMSGYTVLHPMGWDAFGLPAENYALKNKVHPSVAVKKNIAYFKEQLRMLGVDYDWTREIDTTNPNYYKWTQWIFLKLFEKSLAYESNEPINWCPSCKTGLANEDLEAGNCERCGSEVEQKPLRQWVLRITDYAEKLLGGLGNLDWEPHIKEMQRNWIGKSEGHEVPFRIKNYELGIKVFTTRIDTLFGATYLVLAPEHELVSRIRIQELGINVENLTEVGAYIEKSKAKQNIDRTAVDREKTGVELKGVKAINPANGEEIPIWVADYVLGNYGTGAVMAVPAHDERDFAFARKYNLPIWQVVAPEFGDKREGEERRDGGIGFVFDPITQKYAVARSSWKFGVFGGGVDSNEDIVNGTEREVTEESGLYDFKHKEKICATFAHYRNTHRNVNRVTLSAGVLFILESTETKEVKHEPHEDFQLEWATAEEICANWSKAEWKDIGVLHWLFEFKNAVGRCISLGYDTASDPQKFFESPFTGEGILINSGEFTGMTSGESKDKIAEKLGAERKTTYKLRNWVFSRQRYWGEPIPLIHCAECGVVAVPESDLPVVLPNVESYEPTGTGESPLANISDWVNTKCPKCGGDGKRETNTMPQWAGSSWYYLRYIDPHNHNAIFDDKKEKAWMPVDCYVGGAEHATRHLIYARFWHKFLFDIGVVSTEEPFSRLQHVGLVLAEDGRKMSKRWGNVINPNELVLRMGADTFRAYTMFMGPFENEVAWNEDSMVGVRRFLERVVALSEKVSEDSTSSSDLTRLLHATIMKVSEDIESFRFNTAVSSLMIYSRGLDEHEHITRECYKTLLLLLAPFAPHLAEELWINLGERVSIHTSAWPTCNEDLLIKEDVKIAVQVDGKVRTTLNLSIKTTESEAMTLVLSHPVIARWIEGREIVKSVYVQGRIISIVLKPLA